MREEPPCDPELRELLQRGYRYALSLSHDPDRAADLVQDACVAVLAAQGAWTRGYLFAAIRTRFIDRQRRHRLVVVEPIGDDEFGLDSSSWRDEEGLDCDVEALGRALDVLRVEEREALFLTAVEGYTAREVAEATDRPRGTVLSLVHRARAKLRRLLAEPEAVPKR